MPPNHKSLVQQQFGRSADDYATSEVHAAGESLQVLLNLVSPRKEWIALDIATGAGHTAIAFAPLVERVLATDITDEMLEATMKVASDNGVHNVETMIADAESLPFDDHSFELVTCRLAFHHFQKQERVLAEIARVLKPNGIFGFTDNYTAEEPQAVAFYNQFERIRDPSHHWVHPINGLTRLFNQSNLKIEETRQLSKEFEFHQWADRQRVSDADKIRLLNMLDEVPNDLSPLLKPRKVNSTAYFSLAELVLVARPMA